MPNPRSAVAASIVCSAIEWWHLPRPISSRFTASFQRIIRLGFAFMTWRWFRLTHVCFQVTYLYKGDANLIYLSHLSHTFLIQNHFTYHCAFPVLKSASSVHQGYHKEFRVLCCLRVKCWKAKERAQRTREVKIKLNKSKHKLHKAKTVKQAVLK